MCLVITRIVVYKNLLYIYLHILFIIYFKTISEISKKDVNPTSTSGDTCKTIFIILFKLFSIGDLFKSKATQENATDLVTRQHDSRENVKEFIVTSPHVMPRPIISRIANANRARECEHITRTLKRTQLPQDVREPIQQRETS